MTTIKAPKVASPRRSRATLAALKRESRRSVTHDALARQAKSAARRRGRNSLRAAARKAAATRAHESSAVSPLAE